MATEDHPTGATDPLAHWLRKIVVLDTQGPLVYIGTLSEILATSLVLLDADVHDIRDSRAGKELYLLETQEHGVRVNRKRVLVDRSVVVSASLLDDVTS